MSVNHPQKLGKTNGRIHVLLSNALKRHRADTTTSTCADQTAAKVPCVNNLTYPLLLKLDQLM